MKEIEILEGEKNIKDEKTIQLPTNFITIGEVEVDDVKVYIDQNVYKEIEKFSKKDTSHERGGILIGDYAEINSKKHVIISAFIEAKYTDASASTLTFTHETWNYIHDEQDMLYQDKKILGWQHTHPNYGIFLSNYDIFIQENFFNLQWQIAYVVDPIAETRGFFQWKGDKVERINGFYIFDDIGVKINIPRLKPKNHNKKLILFSVILGFLTITSVLLALYFSLEKNNLIKKVDELNLINNKIIVENKILSNELKENKSKYDSTVQKENNTERIIESDKDIIKFKEYVIQNKDTLDTICENNNINYYDKREIILKINGLADENKIYCGEILYLPME